MSSSRVFVVSSNRNAGSLSSASNRKSSRRASISGGDSGLQPYSISRLTAGTVPIWAKSVLFREGMVRIELFQVPSRCWVAANLIAGRWEYGSQSRLFGDGSAIRATSAIALYFIGAAACSSSQLRGNESGSATGVVIEEIDSAAALGAVTIGARYENMAGGAGPRRAARGRIAGFQPEARGPWLSACCIRD